MFKSESLLSFGELKSESLLSFCFVTVISVSEAAF